MTTLQSMVTAAVEQEMAPGVVTLVSRKGVIEEAVGGRLGFASDAPMARDASFRIASLTKPMTAAATMVLIDEGKLRLDDRVDQWLPELASPMVVRTPHSDLDDLVPLKRPITVEDLLTFRVGYGFPADFSLPAVQALLAQVFLYNKRADEIPTPDDWMARLSTVPMLAQPGEQWLYNAGSDILGVLIARVSGRSLPAFLAERLFLPLGMTSTGFTIAPGNLDRLAGSYRPNQSGGIDPIIEAPDQQTIMPNFPSAAGGLLSTAQDLLAFNSMLLHGGMAGNHRLLTAESVHQMMTDHLNAEQRAASTLFLEHQGWGFGGSVDSFRIHPWNVPGRFGWVGGTGTAAHIIPSTETISILLTQVEMTGPTPQPIMHAFWTAVAETT